MHLAAMISLGVPEDYLRKELKKLELKGYGIKIVKANAKGIEGIHVDVLIEEGHHHRKLEDITKIIENSSLSSNVKERSLKMFSKLAEAEAKVHGVDIQDVHFHEVGAVDAIIDIVGAAICIEYINPDLIISSAVELGSGFTKCEHGTFPVPPPAVAELLKDIPVSSGRQAFEATTPTGASIIVSNVDRFEELKSFRIEKTAYGIGTKESEVPNALRLMLGQIKEKDPGHFMLETNIDDMTPEMISYVMEKLFEAGADDVFLTPIVMKKSRNATKLSVLFASILKDNIQDIIIHETSSFGFRMYELDKTELNRDFSILETKYGPVKIKNAYYEGTLIKSKPEYEDCAKIARENNIPIQDVYNLIRKLQE